MTENLRDLAPGERARVYCIFRLRGLTIF